jgi:hypothetical protein
MGRVWEMEEERRKKGRGCGGATVLIATAKVTGLILGGAPSAAYGALCGMELRYGTV